MAAVTAYLSSINYVALEKGVAYGIPGIRDWIMQQRSEASQLPRRHSPHRTRLRTQCGHRVAPRLGMSLAESAPPATSSFGFSWG